VCVCVCVCVQVDAHMGGIHLETYITEQNCELLMFLEVGLCVCVHVYACMAVRMQPVCV
jgi:hypothetical protein